jgi:4-diphosphocytidyl-2-C-methyl-D-erythritol kinase
MASTRAFAPAKINLTLHVTGRRADGYHLLDSLVVFADFGDSIALHAGHGLTLTVSGPMAVGVPLGDDNLVLRAARLAGAADIAIHLEKHLPAAAGIGGGSSDAAAVLRGLGAHGVDALALGADLPVCLLARTARMSGIGEIVRPVDGIPPLPAVLVNPGVAVPTPAVFRAMTRHDGAPMPAIPRFKTVTDCTVWLAAQRNDLEPPAIALAPVIAVTLAKLRATGALLARMSGSGATCFGLFPDSAAAQTAAQTLAAAHPDWWVQPTVLAQT